MKTFRLFSMAAVALMMAACSNNDDAIDEAAPAGARSIPFTATIAAPGSGATTRTTYAESEGTIAVAWKVNDQIALIHNGVKDVVSVATVNDDGSATISGTISVGTDGEATTVTWNTTNVFNESHQNDKLNKTKTTPRTYEGITISGSITDTTSKFEAYNNSSSKGVLRVAANSGGSFTFTAPSGKKFTKIEMTDESPAFIISDANWSQSGSKAVWSGTPSSTVSIVAGTSQMYLSQLTSIVFTLVDE